jgi:hypothetical protein
MINLNAPTTAPTVGATLVVALIVLISFVVILFRAGTR